MLSHLKQARIESGKTLEEISSSLKIRKQYLEALEEGDIKSLPGQVYAKGYLKLYANYLGITKKPVLEGGDNTPDKKDASLRNRQDQIIIDYKYKKYLIIISVLMLLVIPMIYSLM